MPNLLATGDQGPEQTPLARIVFHAELRLRESRDLGPNPTRGSAASGQTAGVAAVRTTEDKWEEKASSDDYEERLAFEIEQAAAAFFGPRVRAAVAIAPDNSIEIAILLTALGALSLYRRHIENIEWFVSHVQGIIKRVLPRPPDPQYRVRVTTGEISVPELPLEAVPQGERTVVPQPRGQTETANRLDLLIAVEIAVLVALAIALLAIYAAR
jgi:hypothetical protein